MPLRDQYHARHQRHIVKKKKINVVSAPMKLTFCRRRYTPKKEREEESNWNKKLIQKKETYGADKRIGRQKRFLRKRGSRKDYVRRQNRLKNKGSGGKTARTCQLEGTVIWGYETGTSLGWFKGKNVQCDQAIGIERRVTGSNLEVTLSGCVDNETILKSWDTR